MGVRIEFGRGGQEYVASDYFGISQLPGGRVRRGEVHREIYDKADKSRLSGPPATDGGSWLMVWDGRTRVLQAGEHPVLISGNGGEADIGILNFQETARENFEVNGGGGEWKTTVDGRVVETGEFHPHTIWWESDAARSGFDFGINGGFM